MTTKKIAAEPRPVGLCMYEESHRKYGLDWERTAGKGGPAGWVCGICHPDPRGPEPMAPIFGADHIAGAGKMVEQEEAA